MVPPILGDMIVRRFVVTIVVVVVMRMSLIAREVLTTKRSVKTVMYSSMTAGAEHDAAPYDVAHDVAAHDALVKDNGVDHERHDEEHVDGKAGPCKAVAMGVDAVVRIKV